jgi:hypothetical protein
VASLVEVESTFYKHSIFRLEIAMWDEGAYKPLGFTPPENVMVSSLSGTFTWMWMCSYGVKVF